MPADSTIRSRDNPLLKRARAVLAGLEPQTLALEGDRLVDDALRAGIALEAVLLAEDRTDRAIELRTKGQPVRLVEPSLLRRASRLNTSPGILALAPVPPPVDPSTLKLDESSLLLIACGVADPGNLGALGRSAEAFGAQALLAVRGSANPWSDKALRGSMGSFLRLPVGYGMEAEGLATVLRGRGVRQLCALTTGGRDLHHVDWSGPIALWIGSETGKLPASSRWFEGVTIPMSGGVESLNVSVAASLLLYASDRSRREGRRD